MDDGHKLVISVSEVLSGWSFISLVGPWQFCVCVSIVPALLQLLACVCRGHTKVTHRTSFLFLRHVGWAVGAELNMPYLACGCLRSHPYIFIELLKLFLYIMCPFLILPYVAFFSFFRSTTCLCASPEALLLRLRQERGVRWCGNSFELLKAPRLWPETWCISANFLSSPAATYWTGHNVWCKVRGIAWHLKVKRQLVLFRFVSSAATALPRFVRQ